jgi:hypothetical protein
MQKEKIDKTDKAPFIKLGQGGEFEKECIEKGILKIDYRDAVRHSIILNDMKQNKFYLIALAVILLIAAGSFFVYQKRVGIKYRIGSLFGVSESRKPITVISENKTADRRKIESALKVENLSYYRAILDLAGTEPVGTIDSLWYWIFQGQITNTSSEPAIFNSDELKLFDSQGNLLLKKDDILRYGQFTKDGYIYAKNLSQKIDEGQGFYKEKDLGQIASIDDNVIVNVPPNSSVSFWFKVVAGRFDRAEFNVYALPYYDNSPSYKQKCLSISKADLISEYLKLDSADAPGDNQKHLGYNMKGSIYNNTDIDLDNPFVFVRIFFKPRENSGNKYMYLPLTCGIKVADKIAKNETVDFDFKNAFIDNSEKRCFGPFNEEFFNMGVYDVAKVETYAWGWDEANTKD